MCTMHSYFMYYVMLSVDFVDASGHERYKSYVNYESCRESLVNTVRFVLRFAFRFYDFFIIFFTDFYSHLAQ